LGVLGFLLVAHEDASAAAAARDRARTRVVFL
jgi:hypothetical protein